MKSPCISEIEFWLAKEFNYRQNIVVPNVSWGLGLHECDLLVLRASGFAVEIEIKRSLADLKAESKKRHIHTSEKIREFWFAVPHQIYDKAVDLVPEKAGILTFERRDFEFSDGKVKKGLLVLRRRPAKVNGHARAFTDQERQKLLHLAHMRIWTMKRQISRGAK
jgi:hypothetical protein